MYVAFFLDYLTSSLNYTIKTHPSTGSVYTQCIATCKYCTTEIELAMYNIILLLSSCYCCMHESVCTHEAAHRDPIYLPSFVCEGLPVQQLYPHTPRRTRNKELKHSSYTCILTYNVMHYTIHNINHELITKKVPRYV